MNQIESAAARRERLFRGRSYEEIGVIEARRILAELRPAGGRPVDVVRDLILDTDEPVRVRFYRQGAQEQLPVLVWMHGGGWCLGGVDTSDAWCREIAARAGCAVVSVDYRLAPEHPFPQPLDDVVRVVDWLHRSGRSLGLDGRMAIGGESAGANLAAAACLRMRDETGARGVVRLVRQLLVVPVVDHDSTRPSMQRSADSALTANDMEWFSRQYVASDSARCNPYSAPMLASSLRGLPDCTVVTAELDPLRDGGRAFARRLADHGAHVSLLECPGVGHGFLASVSSEAGRAAVDWAVQSLMSTFE